MSKIIIAPYPARMRDGSRSAKSYPYWVELIAMLKANSHEVVQIGVTGEDRLDGVDAFLTNAPFSVLREVIDGADTWVSVDSWLPHFCNAYGLKRGVVLWGKSNPAIWGYEGNENLFQSVSNFRSFQFQQWEGEPYDATVFVHPRQVVWAVERVLLANKQSVVESAA